MASFEDLMIGFNDNGYNTVDSFVDRTKKGITDKKCFNL